LNFIELEYEVVILKKLIILEGILIIIEKDNFPALIGLTSILGEGHKTLFMAYLENNKIDLK